MLISLAVLAIAIFGVCSVNTYTNRAAQGNRNRQIANTIASSQLSMAESVLKINFHSDPDGINTPRLTSTQYPTFDFVVEDLGYEDPARNLRAIRSRVFWHENGAARSYELTTTLYNY